MRINPQVAVDFLRAVTQQGSGPDPEFDRHVKLRLAHGEGEYPEAGVRPLPDVLAEIREEFADVGGWSVPALLAIDAWEEEGRINAELAGYLRLKLVNRAAAVRHLWRECTDELEQLAALAEVT